MVGHCSGSMAKNVLSVVSFGKFLVSFRMILLAVGKYLSANLYEFENLGPNVNICIGKFRSFL